MTTVAQFAQFLIKLEPQKCLPRLALYNYLQTHHQPSRNLQAGIFHSFYQKALYFQHWQSHKDQLGQQVRDDLRAFARTTEIPFDLDEIAHAHEMQIVVVDHLWNFSAVLKRWTEKSLDSRSQFRILEPAPNRMLVLVLDHQHNLQVRLYANTMLLVNGQLAPLSPLSQLFYDKEMELQEGVEQYLETSLMSTARFVVENKNSHGFFIRSYTFQRQEHIRGSLAANSEVFYAIKNLEKHFVDPSTDQHYQEIKTLVEKALVLVKNRHPQASTIGPEALKRGQRAVREAFPHDRLLQHLVTNLEYALGQTTSRPAPAPAPAKGAVKPWAEPRNLLKPLS